jgi:hypothetical protein
LALALVALVAPALAGATVEPASIAGESVSHITPTEATLEAEIDTGGVEHGVFYQFQLLYDPGEALTEIECPPSPPPGYSVCVGPQLSDAPPIGFVAGPGTKAVTREVSGLQPGHMYFYRVLAAPAVLTEDSAEWEPPALVGASQDFVTAAGVVSPPFLPAPSPPVGTGGPPPEGGRNLRMCHRQRRHHRRHCAHHRRHSRNGSCAQPNKSRRHPC